MARETKQKVLQLHQEGLSLSQIAEQLGISIAAVRYHLPKKSVKRGSDREMRMAARLYAKGRTQNEIGQELGFSGATVGQWLKRLGVTSRVAGPRGHSSADRQAVIESYRSGVAIAAISREHGISTVTIRNWLSAADIELRPRANKNRAEMTIDAKTVESWAKLHREGKSVTAIARQFRTTKRTVSKLLKLHGHTVRRPGAPPKVATPTKRRLESEYRTARSLDKLAARYGVTRWTVQRWLSLHGIETQSRGSRARTPREVFDQHTPDRPPEGCWEWQGVTAPTGYGIAHLRDDGVSRRIGAHRLSYMLHNGSIERGLVVRHTCHNRRCCNPAHLLVGTHQDNANDRVRAGNIGQHRDPTARERQHRDNLSRLMARVHRDTSSGCWLWQGGTRKSGYGVMVWNPRSPSDPRNIVTHRASYILHKGNIPQGMLVRHLCHVKLCVNPDHLALGTPKTNSRDEADAGKLRVGEKHHRTRMTESRVREMRKLRIAGWSVRRLAAKFGVSEGAVCAITSGRTWRHVDGPLYKVRTNVGAENPSAKLGASEVSRIRRAWENGSATQAELAEQHSVSPGTIAHIVHRRSWKHVE